MGRINAEGQRTRGNAENTDFFCSASSAPLGPGVSANRISRENSRGATETQPAVQGGNPTEPARVAGVVGVLRGSDDPPASKTGGERRRGTWVRVKGTRNGTGDGQGDLDINSAKSLRRGQVHCDGGRKPSRGSALGKPDAGKPLVRFDEGRSETVIGLVPLQPVRSAYSTYNNALQRQSLNLSGLASLANSPYGVGYGYTAGRLATVTSGSDPASGWRRTFRGISAAAMWVPNRIAPSAGGQARRVSPALLAVGSRRAGRVAGGDSGLTVSRATTLRAPTSPCAHS